LSQIATNSLLTTENIELAAALATTTTDIQTAKTVLGNADATVEDIQTVITSIQSSSQALGTLLLKDDEDGIITFALDTSTTATVTKVGEGYGVLVDTLSTASPAMEDANGATATDQTVSTPFAATTESGWHTF
ncbi:muramidase, partial [Streptococcus suis]|nr:muramidase [Streptococcus suis]